MAILNWATNISQLDIFFPDRLKISCTLSAAIASCLALGFGLVNSCKTAKRYLSRALKTAQTNMLVRNWSGSSLLSFMANT